MSGLLLMPVVALIAAAQGGCKAARAELSHTLWPKVQAIVLKQLGPLPGHVDRDDILQEAWIGFDGAIARFDPARGCEPVTFLGRRAIGAAIDALRRDYGPRHSRQPLKHEPTDARDDIQAVDDRLDCEALTADLSDADRQFLALLLAARSCRALAKQSGMCRDTVSTRRARILGAMRERRAAEPCLN